MFGLVSLLGIQYRPALAGLPDQKGWRINPTADYGPLNTFARGKIDLGRIRTHWHDILRVVTSIYTGHVRAYDVVRMLQRDGHPTALGEAIAACGRIAKTLHICTLATDVDYVVGLVKAPAAEFAKCDLTSRAARHHRKQIREALGFRESTRADEERLYRRAPCTV